MSASRSRPLLAALALALVVLGSLLGAHRAAASTRQYALIEDDTRILADPAGTLAQFRALGAQVVRVFLPWRSVAPAVGFSTPPAGFDATDPRAYPQANFAVYDEIDQLAHADGLQLEFVVSSPVPDWAEGPGALDGNQAWEPSASAYGQFVTAVAERYGGGFVPNFQHTALPRVSHWEIWNEPNFGEDLGPQALDGSKVAVAEAYYRGLLNAAWGALRATGHGRDTIIIGQLSARGESGPATATVPDGYPGIDGQTKPLFYLRTLYCLDSRYRPLRGTLAQQEGCPTNAAGTARFRAQNPALFSASGFGIHPYPQGLPPTEDASRDPDFVTFNRIDKLEGALDRAVRAYGSHKQFAIYNNEYGYITRPPDKGHQFATPTVAAEYINWAEYLSWRNPRIATTMQYLLVDPNPYDAPEYGGFASGLMFYGGTVKPGYYAYRMPVFLPDTRPRPRQPVEVWGAARPAPLEARATHRTQLVQIQYARGRSSAFRTIATFADRDPNGYFDLHLAFPYSGTLRTAYADPQLHQTIYSRDVAVSVR